mgnify:FL=1|tara:strand:- start:1311 stop:2192 length:882 start_codon:yes stop_codon:yes gene_type:complete
MSNGPVKPNFQWGPFLVDRQGAGSNVSNVTAPSGDIPYDSLNRRYFSETVEFNRFYTIIKDFVKSRLGFPVVRVELDDFQILTAIDEAISKLDYHAPDWCTQLCAFNTTPGCNQYELPSFIVNNFRYAAYKKSLLSMPMGGQSLEMDFFIKYFQDNFLFQDFAVSDFLLMKMHLKSVRKILGREGSFQIINNKFLMVYPTPMGNVSESVVIEYKCLNSDTLHHYFVNWMQRYALAISKGILGEIRGKYATLPSPQGGAVLNGPALIAESQREMELLENQLLQEIEEPAAFTVY